VNFFRLTLRLAAPLEKIRGESASLCVPRVLKQPCQDGGVVNMDLNTGTGIKYNSKSMLEHRLTRCEPPTGLSFCTAADRYFQRPTKDIFPTSDEGGSARLLKVRRSGGLTWVTPNQRLLLGPERFRPCDIWCSELAERLTELESRFMVAIILAISSYPHGRIAAIKQLGEWRIRRGEGEILPPCHDYTTQVHVHLGPLQEPTLSALPALTS
jgi:hypothetical protein